MSAIQLVVAMSQNRVIGRDGQMPWHLSADLKRFKAITLNQPIIMGRKTFASIGKPLPQRLNIVVTRDQAFAPDGVYCAQSLDNALEVARQHLAKMPEIKFGEGRFQEDEGQLNEILAKPAINIIGGGQIYAQSMALAQRLLITQVEATLAGDTYFPQINEQEWDIVFQHAVKASDKDSYRSELIVYERR